jgi:hypothetical protein
MRRDKALMKSWSWWNGAEYDVAFLAMLVRLWAVTA